MLVTVAQKLNFSGSPILDIHPTFLNACIPGGAHNFYSHVAHVRERMLSVVGLSNRLVWASATGGAVKNGIQFCGTELGAVETVRIPTVPEPDSVPVTCSPLSDHSTSPNVGAHDLYRHISHVR